MTTTEVLRKTIEKNGTETETAVAMEECAELIQAISKCRRYGYEAPYSDNLIEEIADVMVCIDMLQVIYGFDFSEVYACMNMKLERLRRELG